MRALGMGTSGSLCRVGAMVAPFISQVRALSTMPVSLESNITIKYTGMSMKLIEKGEAFNLGVWFAFSN